MLCVNNKTVPPFCGLGWDTIHDGGMNEMIHMVKLNHHVNDFIHIPFFSESVKMEPNGPVRVHLVPFVRCQKQC